MSTLKATNLQHASATSPNIVLGSDGSVAVGGGNISPQTGFKNRVINGDMRIDQRNAGASVTNVSGTVYTVDRWVAGGNQASKFTVQQNAGSVTPPAGFINYLGVTSSSAYTVGASEAFRVSQIIEGFNAADFGWGTANASTVTISFWVRSSLAGTFGGSVFNSAGNRSYPFSYTISSANTWEQKSITITGDTSGTWATNNTAGLYLNFSLGAGSTLSGTSGAWASAAYYSATGATSVVGTNGATFYITGVQLEKGTVATPFEFRSIGQELALCQRYYWQCVPRGVAGGLINITNCISRYGIRLPQTMRATPTVSSIGTFAIDDYFSIFAQNGTLGPTSGTNEQFIAFELNSFSQNMASLPRPVQIHPSLNAGILTASAEL